MEDKCVVLFRRVCEFMETLQTLKGKKKQQTLQQFFQNSKVSNFFPIVRLMVPLYDMERGSYGLKEVTLAKYYSELLSLPNAHKNALIHFKNPKMQLPGSVAGGFVEILESILSDRAGESKNLTVEQINTILDDLANAIDKPSKKKVLSTVVRNLNALEQKWIVKIILKDMKMGAHDSILKAFHSQALEIYSYTNNLREVFSTINDPNFSSDIQLFKFGQPIKPMLAGRKQYLELKNLLINEEVIVEIKYDGERIECHWSATEANKYFSRNAVDYTYLYGGHLDEVLNRNIEGVSACILDGELIVWDTENGCAAPFGQNKAVALGSAEGKNLCYMVFDILYYEKLDGTKEDLMGKPLHERKNFLSLILNDKVNCLEKVEYQKRTGFKAVLDDFNTAVENNEEGIIVKRSFSPYIPDDRSILWLKMKTDYFEGLSDSLDLLIVGGYFGKSFRTNDQSEFDHITVFLLALASRIDLKNPEKSKFIPVSKVGTGYSIQELTDLRRHLKPAWKPFKKSPEYWSRWVPGAGEKPDYFIDDPSKSVVLEVKASELVVTEKFPSRHTLRFPKVARIRYDKPWDQATSYTDFQGMIENYSRGVTEKSKALEDREPVQPVRKRRRETKPKGQVLPEYRDTDTTQIIPYSSIFSSCEFYIPSLKNFDKALLEKTIVENGGKKVQNFLPSTTHVIASEVNSMRVANLIEKFNLDIIKPEWVMDCAHLQTWVELQPKYMIHTTEELKKKFAREFNQYGDSVLIPYQRPEDILEIVEKVPPTQCDLQNYPINLKEIPRFKLQGEIVWVFADHPLLKAAIGIRIELHGGVVVQEYSDIVTLVVLIDQNLPFESSIPQIFEKDLTKFLYS